MLIYNSIACLLVCHTLFFLFFTSSAELFSSTAAFDVCRALDRQPSCFLFLPSWALWCSSVLDWWHTTTVSLRKKRKRDFAQKDNLLSQIIKIYSIFSHLITLFFKLSAVSVAATSSFILQVTDDLLQDLNHKNANQLNHISDKWLKGKSCKHSHRINKFVFLCRVVVLSLRLHHVV